MFGQPKFWQTKYLGGWHEFPQQKNVHLVIVNDGLLAKSIFLAKPLFLIRWASIEELGQDLIHKQEQTALGGVMEGIGMIGASGVTSGNQLGGFSLQSAGQGAKKHVTEHFLQIRYNVNSVKGIAAFEFRSSFWNKRPVLQFIGYVNQIRLDLKKPA